MSTGLLARLQHRAMLGYVEGMIRKFLDSAMWLEINPLSQLLTALYEEEKVVKESARSQPLMHLISSLNASFKVFFFFLLTVETLVVLGITTGLTLHWYHNYREDASWGASYMDWFFVGFAVVGTMSASITISFNRREAALLNLSRVRSYANHIYLAHALWDWDNGKGRAKSDVDWLEHTDKVMAQLIGMADELSRFLRLPTATLCRHRMTAAGRIEASKILRVSFQLYDSLSVQRMNRLTKYGEYLKATGLSPSEMSRIQQFERWLGETVENLRHVKMYRTPQTLRSCGRVFTLFLPPFYSPTFASLAIEVKSLTVGIIMSIVTTITLMALFESIQVIEDPFVAYRVLDGIDVREELEVLFWQQMVETRRYLFPGAPPYPKSSRNPLIGSYQHNLPESVQRAKDDDTSITGEFSHEQSCDSEIVSDPEPHGTLGPEGSAFAVVVEKLHKQDPLMSEVSEGLEVFIDYETAHEQQGSLCPHEKTVRPVTSSMERLGEYTENGVDEDPELGLPAPSPLDDSRRSKTFEIEHLKRSRLSASRRQSLAGSASSNDDNNYARSMNFLRPLLFLSNEMLPDVDYYQNSGPHLESLENRTGSPSSSRASNDDGAMSSSSHSSINGP